MDERPFTTSYHDGTRTLSVTGSVDETSGLLLREAIDKHSDACTQRLSIDLSDVDFLPSLGVGVLAVAMRSAQENGTEIDLVAASGTIAQQVLSICGLPHRQS